MSAGQGYRDSVNTRPTKADGSQFGFVVINPDGSWVNSVLYKIVRWLTSTSFSKGINSNTEVLGSGETAYVQLEENSDNDGDILYDDVSNYTLSDSSKITVDQNDNNKATLKNYSGGSASYPFDTPGNYIYNASNILVSGDARQKPTLVNGTFYASYNGHINGTFGSGTLTGTGYNNPSVSGGELDLTGGSLKYVSYDADLNADSQQTGCIRALIRPNYSGNPSSPQWFAMITKAHNDNDNIVCFYHETSGNIYIMIKDYAGTTLFQANLGAWSPTSGTQYEFEMNWDITSGATRLFINGTQFGATRTTTGTRDASIGLLRVGANAPANVYANFKCDGLAIFSSVKHTGNYTPTGITPYATDNPTIYNNTGYAYSTELNDFTADVTAYLSDTVKFQVSIDDGSTWIWWNGATWATITGAQTDTWYYNNESNIASDINSNLSGLGASGTFRWKAFLHSSTGGDTPILDNIYVANPSAYSTDDDLYIDTTNTSRIAPASIYSWLTIEFSETLPVGTDIKALFSVDGRNNWLTWTGSEWDAPTDATDRDDATSISDAETNFASLPLGNGTLDVRLFLYSSDALETPDVDNINVASDGGFKTTGTYYSNPYNAESNSIVWGAIDYDITVPAGDTLVIKARSSNDINDLGDYTSALSNGEETNLVGRYLEWKADFVGDGVSSPSINSVGFSFISPQQTEVQP